MLHKRMYVICYLTHPDITWGSFINMQQNMGLFCCIFVRMCEQKSPMFFYKYATKEPHIMCGCVIYIQYICVIYIHSDVTWGSVVAKNTHTHTHIHTYTHTHKHTHTHTHFMYHISM